MNSSEHIETNRRIEREEREHSGRGGGTVWPGGGSSRVGSEAFSDHAGDTGPVVDARTATAGSSDAYMRDDTLHGLKLVKNPADGASLAQATLQFTDDGGARNGLQVKLKTQYGSNKCVVLVDTDGLYIPVDESEGLSPNNNLLKIKRKGGGGIGADANGIYVSLGNGLAVSGSDIVIDLAAAPGLEFSGGDLRAKLKAGGGLAVDADGLYASGSGIGNKSTTFLGTSVAIDSTPDKVMEVSLPGAGTYLVSACATIENPASTGGGTLYLFEDDGATEIAMIGGLIEVHIFQPIGQILRSLPALATAQQMRWGWPHTLANSPRSDPRIGTSPHN